MRMYTPVSGSYIARCTRSITTGSVLMVYQYISSKRKRARDGHGYASSASQADNVEDNDHEQDAVFG